MTPDRLRLASACSAALGALVAAGTVDTEACAALARHLREEGIEALMHAGRLRGESQEQVDPRTLPDTVDELPSPTLDEVRRKLGTLKVQLFIVSTWPWDMQVEYELGQILAELDGVTSAWSTSTLPGYPTESMIAARRRQAAESLDLHHVNVLGLLEQRRVTDGGPQA
ncbi:hypothetical protein ACFY1P_33920 [Streptomyces sp. NPDC001407]|uniref:hypothetical protein n=1 Tax=Streptomyces sp. NPDC001407 TaxID=3364573 RepID=UPI003690130F